jgi:hypothetical protein
MEAGAVLQRAAILIGALVGDRRKEARPEIAVREMQFEPFKLLAPQPLIAVSQKTGQFAPKP